MIGSDLIILKDFRFNLLSNKKDHFASDFKGPRTQQQDRI